MNESRQQLITDLTSGVAPVNPVPAAEATALLWSLLAAGIAALLLTLTGPWRPGAYAQLLQAPQFAAEMALGVLALASGALWLFRSSIPGRAGRPLGYVALLLLLAWLGLILYGLVNPALAPSMAGKRPHCMLETPLYALLPALLGAWLARRGYPLRPLLTLGGLAAVAGLTVALLMQLACMYQPLHGLLWHVMPGLLLGAVAAIAAALLSRLRR